MLISSRQILSTNPASTNLPQNSSKTTPPKAETFSSASKPGHPQGPSQTTTPSSARAPPESSASPRFVIDTGTNGQHNIQLPRLHHCPAAERHPRTTLATSNSNNQTHWLNCRPLRARTNLHIPHPERRLAEHQTHAAIVDTDQRRRCAVSDPRNDMGKGDADCGGVCGAGGGVWG